MTQVRSLALASALAFLGFTVATSYANGLEQEKKAEDVYKNIKSYKGQPASAIMPAMHAMSQALGTDCAHCHQGQDFASDDLRPKETTREMIELTREINNKYFNGRPEVTCFTCHHGVGHPDGTASPFPVPPRLRGGGTAAEPVLTGFAEATKKPASLVHIKLVGTTSGTEPHEVTTYQSSDGKFYESEKGRYTIGYDLKDGWVDVGNGTRNIVPPPDSEALIRFGRTFWSGLPELTQATSGTETVDGKAMKVVRATMGKSAVKLFFDATTKLLFRVVYFDRSIEGPMNDIYDYEDYKSVGGTMVPMKTSRWEGTKKVSRIYTSATIESSVDAKQYAPK